MTDKKFKLHVIATFAQEYSVKAKSLEKAKQKAEEMILHDIKCSDMDLDADIQVHEAEG